MYVDDLVFATADTEALTLVKSELQKRHTCTELGELLSYLGLQITRDRARRTITLTQSHMVHQVLQRFCFQCSSPRPTSLSTSHSLSAPPSDESVEPSGPYPELVGCLMYLMTCTRPDLAYPLSLLARYVAPGDADASWVDDSATQRSSQGYTFSLGSNSVSWRSTRSSLVLSSSCEAEIFHLSYVATRANTADIFTKALPPGAARGAASWGAEPASAEPRGGEPASAHAGGAEPEGAEPRGAEFEGAESGGAEPEGAKLGGAKPEGAKPGGC
ncbi:unnamed protein product [Closterium sp. NIES-53]